MKKYYAEDIFKLAEGIEPSADDRAVYLCSEADEVILGLRTSLGKSVKDVLSFMHQLDEKDAVIAELRAEVYKGTPKPEGPSYPTSTSNQQFCPHGWRVGFFPTCPKCLQAFQEQYQGRAILGQHSDPPDSNEKS